MFIYIVLGMCLARPETYGAIAAMANDIYAAIAACKGHRVKKRVPTFHETFNDVMTSIVTNDSDDEMPPLVPLDRCDSKCEACKDDENIEDCVCDTRDTRDTRDTPCAKPCTTAPSYTDNIEERVKAILEEYKPTFIAPSYAPSDYEPSSKTD